MNCRHFDSRLDAYLDGELDAPRRAELEGHASGCPACRAQMEALRQAEHALRGPEFHAAPPGMLTEFHRRLAGRPARRPAFAWRLRLGAAAGTALAAAAALAAFALLSHTPSGTKSTPPSSGRLAGTEAAPQRPSTIHGRPYMVPPPTS